MEVIDCYKFYDFNPEDKVAEVIALGEIDYGDDDTKCATNNIHIVCELNWYDVFDVVNIGKGCTGQDNTGDYKSGNPNTGNHNNGNHNSGNRNSGFHNSGDYNIEGFNSSYYNNGYHNTGNCNAGNYNTGNYNSGDYNTGDYNTGNYNTGCFNSINVTTPLFNKQSNWILEDWRQSEARWILMCIPKNTVEWVREEKMNDKEKDANPNYKVTGGYLKESLNTTSPQNWWNALDDNQKSIVMSLPNFDPDIFKEITGIETRL